MEKKLQTNKKFPPIYINTFSSIGEKLSQDIQTSTTGCPIKGIDKKLLVRAAHGSSSQFLNLFEFSISVSFV